MHRLYLLLTCLLKVRGLWLNHRMVDVGRDLWRLCPNPVLRQSHLEQVAQDHFQMEMKMGT